MAVVVVNWEGVSRSIRCLLSTLPMRDRVLRVLVDSGSAEDPTPPVRAAVPGAAVLRLECNRGYAAGCNAGAAWALSRGATHLLFLNNDVTVDAGAIDALLAGAQQHPSAILAPLVAYDEQPRRVWSAGGIVERPWLKNRHLGQGSQTRDHGQPRRVDWATGCALFLAAPTFRRLGPIDEEYFLYLEDTDWCLRAARLGVETWLIPDAVIWHQVSASVRALPPAAVRYYAYRNQYRLEFRQGPAWLRPLVLLDALWTLGKAAARWLLFPSYRGDAYYHARTRGVVDFLRGHWGPAPALGTDA